MGEVRERLHVVDPENLEIIAQVIEFELPFEVMHTCTQNRLTVQGAPHTNRAVMRRLRKDDRRKVHTDLIRPEVDIRKQHARATGVFKYLSAPTRLCSGIETL